MSEQIFEIDCETVDEMIRKFSSLDKVTAARKLTEFYVKARFRLSGDDFHRQYVDGRNDGGIDFHHVEDNTFYIIQTKFSGEPIHVDENTILEEIRKINNTITAENPNQRAEDFVNSLKRQLQDPEAVLEVIWLTTNMVEQSVSDAIQTKLNELRTHNNWQIAVDFLVIDRFVLDNVIYDFDHDFIPYTGKREVRIEKGRYIENTGEATGLYSVLCSVDVNDILRWFTDSSEVDHFLQKNIREYLGDTAINKKIRKSYLESPDWFWYKHNGIIIFADSVSIDKVNAKLVLRNPQIVNGGQTLRTLFTAYDKNDGRDSPATVLIRIYRLPYEDRETYKHSIDIIAALNTQTPIRSSDLKSTDPRQVRIERLLNAVDLKYHRKRAKEAKSSRSNVTMRSLAMVYYACKKQAPHEGVIGNVEDIFGEESKYEYVFPLSEIDAELSSSHVVVRYATAWALYYDIIGEVEKELPRRDAQLMHYTEYFVLVDLYKRLWDWKQRDFDMKGWRNWMEFVRSEELLNGLWAYCRLGFKSGREIIPRSADDARKFLRTKEAAEKFSDRTSKRAFNSVAQRAYRKFKARHE